jgi:hypothetical protein
VTGVTAAGRGRSYVLLVEARGLRGENDMTAAITTKISNLVLAAAFLLPGALATLHQAAQIVA